MWFGLVWYGMVWYGMVWYGMVRYGIADRHNMVITVLTFYFIQLYWCSTWPVPAIGTKYQLNLIMSI
jgi:hypothetical protein